MKKIGNFEFQTLPFQAEHWEPFVMCTPLAKRVLVVAQTRIEGKWCAYIDAVPGECHKTETDSVLAHGSKMPEPVARILFPTFDGVPYAD